MRKALVAAEIAAGIFWLLTILAVVTLPPLAPVPGCTNALKQVAVTAPWVRIAFLGDINNVGAFNVEQLLREADAQKPDLIVIGGDLTHGDATPLKLRFTLEQIRRAGCRAPIVVAPGNHDLSGDASGFSAAFDGFETNVEVGDITVAIVNQYASDERVIESVRAARRDGQRLIVVQHEPLVYLTDRSTPVRPAVSAALREIKPDIVLAGHAHGFWDFEIDGYRHIIVGGRPKHEDDAFVQALAFIEETPEGFNVEAPSLTMRNPPLERLRHGFMRIVDKAMRGKIDSLVIFAASLLPFIAHVMWIIKRRKKRAPENPLPAAPVL